MFGQSKGCCGLQDVLFRESTISSNKMFIATFPSDPSHRTLTWSADEQGTDESGVHIPHCVHLGGVGVGEALGVTEAGAIISGDVPHVLVVPPRKDSVILLLLARCGIIVPGACKENSLLRIPRHDFRSRSESKQEKKAENPKCCHRNAPTLEKRTVTETCVLSQSSAKNPVQQEETCVFWECLRNTQFFKGTICNIYWSVLA